MYGLTALRREMAQIGANLDRPVDAYLIGGCAMSFSGLKTATKDIDMVLRTEGDLQVLTSVLEDLDYGPLVPLDRSYDQLAPRRIYAKDGAPQVDLFIHQVCNALLLSPGMIGRAIPEPGFDKLRLYRVAASDILIFKSITERKADEADIEALLAAGVHWPAVLDEMHWQAGNSETAWSKLFFERMEAFSERGYVIPILGELEVLVDRDVGEKIVLFHLGERTLTREELYQKISEDPQWVDSCVSALLKQGRITQSQEGLRRVA